MLAPLIRPSKILVAQGAYLVCDYDYKMTQVTVDWHFGAMSYGNILFSLSLASLINFQINYLSVKYVLKDSVSGIQETSDL